MRCIIALFLLFPCTLVAAAEAVRVSPEQVRRWIEQLDHDDFQVREQAATSLAHVGHPAILPLAESILSQNPEVAWRSSESLQRMAMEGDEATMDRIVHVLGDLAKRGKPGLAQLAAEMRDKQRAFRHSRAAAELRKLGAYVAGPSGEAFDEEGPDGIVDGAAFGLAMVEMIEIDDAPEPELPGAEVEAVELPAIEEETEVPTDFRLPALDEEEDEWLEDIVAEDIFPGEEMEEAEMVADVDIGVAMPAIALGGPIFFGGGMMIGEGSGATGVMSLSHEWRGGNDALKHMKDLSGIVNLQIEHADVSDDALPHIAKMMSLKHLTIRGGKFSRDSLRTFHRQRPTVSIMAMGEGMMGVNGQFDAKGCILDSVFGGSAAHEAGLQAGDKVLSIAGDPVNDFSELTICVSTRKPGDKLKVVYERAGEKHETDVTLKQRPAGQ